MKIATNKKIVLALCCGLSHTNINTTPFHNDLEQEFITRMNDIQQQFQNVTNDMESTLKQVQEQIISPTNPKRAIDPHGFYLNNIQNQNNSHYYQQSSNSLSFTNKEKTIKISEQKDLQKTVYLITVTNKTTDGTTPTEPSNTAADLQKLATYTKKAFHSQSADAILHECINALQDDQKDRVLNVETSVDGNQTTYTIKVTQKQPSNEDLHTPWDRKSRRKKKAANRS